MTDVSKCELCGEPMPDGEEMFKFHGYSGPCPKEPLPVVSRVDTRDEEIARLKADAERKQAVIVELVAVNDGSDEVIAWVASGGDVFDKAFIAKRDDMFNRRLPAWAAASKEIESER